MVVNGETYVVEGGGGSEGVTVVKGTCLLRVLDVGRFPDDRFAGACKGEGSGWGGVLKCAM